MREFDGPIKSYKCLDQKEGYRKATSRYLILTHWRRGLSIRRLQMPRILHTTSSQLGEVHHRIVRLTFFLKNFCSRSFKSSNSRKRIGDCSRKRIEFFFPLNILMKMESKLNISHSSCIGMDFIATMEKKNFC